MPRKFYDPKKTVIIEVSGGVADCSNAPEGINVVIVDYDNYPDAEVSATSPTKRYPQGRLVVDEGDESELPWSVG